MIQKKKQAVFFSAKNILLITQSYVSKRSIKWKTLICVTLITNFDLPIQSKATIYGNPEEFHAYLTIEEIEKRNETSRIKEVEETTLGNWF